MGTTQKQEPAIKGEDIRTLREKMGISLKVLADDLKIDSGLLSKIENNKRPSTSTLSDWYKSHSTTDTHSTQTQTDSDAQISLF
ncbi:MAG: helix-turn-helix transcriptional regulator [Nitrospinae bacterium]|nr:helix-turn-helix transcriptional regulator [Nitrospinota bacterium]